MSKTGITTNKKNTDSSKTLLEQHFRDDNSFPTAFLRAASAIASNDGKVSLAEYAALKELTKLTGESALAGAVLHHSLEYPISIDEAFKQLYAASGGVDHQLKNACFEITKPLISLQGTDTKKIAQSFAKNLRHEISTAEIDSLSETPNTSLWNVIAKRTLQKLRGEGLEEFAEECYRVTGDQAVLAKLHALQKGKIDEGELTSHIISACHEIQRQLSEYEASFRDAMLLEKSAIQFINSVKELDNQISQRVEVFRARASLEKRMLKEDIDDAVHDAGNAIELEIADRLKTDKWKLVQVWESIARSSFGKELERRTDRIVSRREESLRMFQEDLRLFQNELRISRASILERRHHADYAKLMPSLRTTTRLINAVDDAANTTFWAGTLSIFGGGAAVYAFGAAVVFPVIAPVAPFIGGAMAVAGVWKWLSEPSLRKDEEIRHKRVKFEQVFREQLNKAQVSFETQLDTLEVEFKDARDKIITPLLLEAQAAEQLEELQFKMTTRLIKNSRTATTRLISKLSALPA